MQMENSTCQPLISMKEQKAGSNSYKTGGDLRKIKTKQSTYSCSSHGCTL